MANIVDDGRGTYSWVYEFNLFTNPTILATVLKVVLGTVAAIALFMLVLLVPDMVRGYADMSDVLATLRLGGILMALFFVLTCVAYALYGAMQGGKYCVVFTMDEDGIVHKQLPRQFEKAQVLSALNILAGVATGNITEIGIGLTSARDTTSSDFSAVRSIKGSRLLRVIKVNEPFAKNQVYVEADDYDFVFDYIVSHCPNAQVKG